MEGSDLGKEGEGRGGSDEPGEWREDGGVSRIRCLRAMGSRREALAQAYDFTEWMQMNSSPSH